MSTTTTINDYYQVISINKGWYTICWYHNNEIQKVHGKRNLELILSGLDHVRKSTSAVNQELDALQDEATIDEPQPEVFVEEVQPKPSTTAPVDSELSDLVAIVNSQLNTFDYQFDNIRNDADALYENLDGIECCIDELQCYQQDNGSTNYTRKALVKANNLHTKYNDRIELLDTDEDSDPNYWDNHAESDDDFLTRITGNPAQPQLACDPNEVF